MMFVGNRDYFQAGWVVDDLESAVEKWLALTGIGPFFVLPHVGVSDIVYRGRPASLDFSVALAQAGPMQIELIQQHDDAPSAYRDVFPVGSGGFHHFCRFARDLDAELQSYRTNGIEVTTTGALGDMRFAYVDTRESLSHIVEIVEDKPFLRELFAVVADASKGWTGTNPVRSF